MQAIINGVTVTGTPEEIAEYSASWRTTRIDGIMDGCHGMRIRNFQCVE